MCKVINKRNLGHKLQNSFFPSLLVSVYIIELSKTRQIIWKKKNIRRVAIQSNVVFIRFPFSVGKSNPCSPSCLCIITGDLLFLLSFFLCNISLMHSFVLALRDSLSVMVFLLFLLYNTLDVFSGTWELSQTPLPRLDPRIELGAKERNGTIKTLG